MVQLIELVDINDRPEHHIYFLTTLQNTSIVHGTTISISHAITLSLFKK